MNYTDSIFDFFKSPKWGINLLLGGICILIPIVGPIALMGWHVSGMYGRSNWRDFESYPDFDFGKFGQYLERGVWPFVMQLLAALAMIPIVLVVLGGPMIAMISLMPPPDSHASSPQEVPPAVLVMIPMMMLGYLGLIALMVIVGKPLVLRAAMTQDFSSAFNWAFMKSFIAKVWIQQIVSVLFVIFAAMVLMLIGAIACFVGIYFTMSLVFFAQWHLDRQMYELYLARGGEPVQVSAKLSDVPPPLPG